VPFYSIYLTCSYIWLCSPSLSLVWHREWRLAIHDARIDSVLPFCCIFLSSDITHSFIIFEIYLHSFLLYTLEYSFTFLLLLFLTFETTTAYTINHGASSYGLCLDGNPRRARVRLTPEASEDRNVHGQPGCQHKLQASRTCTAGQDIGQVRSHAAGWSGSYL